MLAKWHIRRQRLLHGICQNIAQLRADGMSAARAYRKGRRRWNNTKLAKQRGRMLSESGIRAIYARWLSQGHSATAFAPGWKSSTVRKITSDQAIRWTRRVIEERICFSELFRRLRRENPSFTFSYSALCLNLPSHALRKVRAPISHYSEPSAGRSRK